MYSLLKKIKILSLVSLDVANTLLENHVNSCVDCSLILRRFIAFVITRTDKNRGAQSRNFKSAGTPLLKSYISILGIFQIKKKTSPVKLIWSCIALIDESEEESRNYMHKALKSVNHLFISK